MLNEHHTDVHTTTMRLDMDIDKGRALVGQIPVLLSGQLKSGSRIKRGLEILERHTEDMSADIHDGNLFVADFEATLSTMSEEEVIELSRLGWYECEDAWAYAT